LPEGIKVAEVFDNKSAWYFKAREQPVLKLFEQFFDYANYMKASEEFYDIFQNNSVLDELYSVMELIYETGNRIDMGVNRYFQRESIEELAIWKLIRRLANETLTVAHEENTPMTVSFEEVICN
jgi:hypothetical protein